ncbi:hypothetical protein DFH06DRAFT_1187412 [Mycena polygramma]|nr:hypothetical protein DFH06DRAFT_1187412 [Mycena polygramma]
MGACISSQGAWVRRPWSVQWLGLRLEGSRQKTECCTAKDRTHTERGHKPDCPQVYTRLFTMLVIVPFISWVQRCRWDGRERAASASLQEFLVRSGARSDRQKGALRCRQRFQARDARVYAQTRDVRTGFAQLPRASSNGSRSRWRRSGVTQR